MDAALPKINQPWTLHDIRRTVATRMGDLGVQPHITEAVLNHISGSNPLSIANSTWPQLPSEFRR